MGIANLSDLHDDIYINLLREGNIRGFGEKPDYFA